MESTQEVKNWPELHKLFYLRADDVMSYTNEVRDICSEALSASHIHHPPITSRVKSWESVKNSIDRRNQERILGERLREVVEARGRRWEDYTRETGLNLSEDGTELFQSSEERLAAVDDFGGIRILLYSPGDIERVAAVLDKQFNVVRRLEKGQTSQANSQGLEERLKLLQGTQGDTQSTTDVKEPERYKKGFLGYRGTHFLVKLRDEDIREENKRAWEDIVIEIQVRTVIMDVWSEIADVLIHQQLDCEGAKISEDEERILDLINGIVLTGEVALRQLEASTAQRRNKCLDEQP